MSQAKSIHSSDLIAPKGPEETIATLEKGQVLSFENCITALKEHLVFTEPFQYSIFMLLCAQVYLKDVLPNESCMNLAFSGDVSSGKTKATKIATWICKGEFFEAGSQAALIRLLEKSTVLGVDEWDYNSERLKDLEGILIASNTWDASYPLLIPTKKGEFKFRDIDIGGPKFLNWRKKPSTALISRTWVFEMEGHADTRMIIKNLYLDNPTEKISTWLERRCAKVIKKWSERKVREHLNTEAFQTRLDKLPYKIGRHREMGAILLVISDIMELDLFEDMKSVLQSKIEEEEEYQEVAEVLREIYIRLLKRPLGERRELQSAVLILINDKRKVMQMPPIFDREWASIRRRYGFVAKKNVKKSSTMSGNVELFFDVLVENALFPRGLPKMGGESP